MPTITKEQSCTHVFNNKGTNHQYERVPCDMVNTEVLFHLWSFRNDSHCIGRTFRHHIPDFIKFASGKHFLQRYLVARTLPIPLASSAAFALSVATAHLEQAIMMPEKVNSCHLDTPCHQALEHCRVDTSSHSGPVDSTSLASPHRAIPSMVTVFRVQDPTWVVGGNKDGSNPPFLESFLPLSCVLMTLCFPSANSPTQLLCDLGQSNLKKFYHL